MLKKRDIHRYTLINLNACVYYARRDAAYNRLEEVLHEDMMLGSKEERYHLYVICQQLLSDAIVAGKKATDNEDDAVNEFFYLLRDTIGAAAALVRYELSLAEESMKLRAFVGEGAASHLKGTDDVFSSSEMNIFYCIEDLLGSSDPAVQRDKNEQFQNFPKGEKMRYRIAYGEYRQYYLNTDLFKKLVQKKTSDGYSFNLPSY